MYGSVEHTETRPRTHRQADSTQNTEQSTQRLCEPCAARRARTRAGHARRVRSRAVVDRRLSSVTLVCAVNDTDSFVNRAGGCYGARSCNSHAPDLATGFADLELATAELCVPQSTIGTCESQVCISHIALRDPPPDPPRSRDQALFSLFYMLCHNHER